MMKYKISYLRVFLILLSNISIIHLSPWKAFFYQISQPLLIIPTACNLSRVFMLPQVKTFLPRSVTLYMATQSINYFSSTEFSSYKVIKSVCSPSWLPFLHAFLLVKASSLTCFWLQQANFSTTLRCRWDLKRTSTALLEKISCISPSSRKPDNDYRQLNSVDSSSVV